VLPHAAIAPRRRLSLVPLALAATVALSTLVASAPATPPAPTQAVHDLTHVIVRSSHDAVGQAVHGVTTAGGRVLHPLLIINGFDALVPASALPALRGMAGVASVTVDAGVQFTSAPPDSSSWKGAKPYKAHDHAGSMFNVVREVRADKMWEDGYAGAGIGVALIDSGVAPVSKIAANLVNGPDLSLDATGGPSDGIDAFGHGTHLAGIIAGKDPAAGSDPKDYDKDAEDHFLGVAPDAKVISLKTATADGSVDVSQIIAAIDWVVQHRNDPGMNIRVLNLSFGTDGTQDASIDPLTYAVEVAWRAGIVVVVSAGNNGADQPQLNNPASDPLVISVGAQDQFGTPSTSDDVIADFSSRGNRSRRPELMAPGRSIVSLRVPGSVIDEEFPGGRVDNDDEMFKGSGTSQSAAVVSGVVALMLQRYPQLTPDQVKALLMNTGRPLKTSKDVQLEAGMKTFDASQAPGKVKDVLQGKIPSRQTPTATGLGSLDAARGSFHLVDPTDGSTLSGEIDVTGAAWDPATWSAASLAGRSWSGDSWLGRSWSGRSWSGRTWSGRTWSGAPYDGRTWSGRSWSGGSWFGRTWSGRTWSGRTWSSADLDYTAASGA
jgi:serine protease AprX